MTDVTLFYGDTITAALRPPFAKMSFEVMYCSLSSYTTEKKLDSTSLVFLGIQQFHFAHDVSLILLDTVMGPNASITLSNSQFPIILLAVFLKADFI